MIALYTLVVDRLEYTKKVIHDLESQDVEFVHFILSQGSNKETDDWLSRHKYTNKTYLYGWDENRGISHGSNFLIEEISNRMGQFPFDLIAKVDNDYEALTPNWLGRCANVARDFNILCSPLVLGLGMFPDGVPGYTTQTMAGETVRLTRHIGGVVHMAKAALHLQYRYSTDLTLAVDQDISFTGWAKRKKHYLVGYLEDVKIAHKTAEQEAENPDYFERKKQWEQTKSA